MVGQVWQTAHPWWLLLWLPLHGGGVMMGVSLWILWLCNWSVHISRSMGQEVMASRLTWEMGYWRGPWGPRPFWKVAIRRLVEKMWELLKFSSYFWHNMTHLCHLPFDMLPNMFFICFIHFHPDPKIHLVDNLITYPLLPLSVCFYLVATWGHLDLPCMSLVALCESPQRPEMDSLQPSRI